MIPDKKGRALGTVQKFSNTSPDKTSTIPNGKNKRLLKDRKEKRKKTVMPRGVKKSARVLTDPQKQVVNYCQEWITKHNSIWMGLF